jgi:hypothetical protein
LLGLVEVVAGCYPQEFSSFQFAENCVSHVHTVARKRILLQ